MNSDPSPQSATSIDGVPLAWYDFGGSGADLLLAHATGFCAMVWRPVIDHLTQNFHCVAYDMRGHGLSGRPRDGSNGWDWSLYADDARAVIEAAGLEYPFGIGHSCGGATEILLEEARPGTFQKLFLFEPVVFTEDPPTGPDPQRDLAIRTRKRKTTFINRETVRQTFSERGPFVQLHGDAIDGYLDYGFTTNPDGSLTLRCRPDDEAEVYVMASAHTGFTYLHEIKCPVTVERGIQSKNFSRDDMQTVAERIPNGEFVEVNGVGHFGPLEQPEQFAAQVTEFVTASL